MPASVPTDAPDREVGENPLVEGLERLPVPPTTMVIFGASGDLAQRKLLPALYARFYSRGNGDYTNRVLAALRNQFGGHAVERTSGGG